MKNTQIVHVVAIDRKHCIGKDNQLAWHIPEDLKHFKAITANGVVIMGRKTFESIGKPLPNRINWVITRDKAWRADGVKVAHSLEQALTLASDDCTDGKLFIIGGGEIYRQSIDIADILEITRVDLDIGGDAFYPAIPSEFTLVKSKPNVSEDGINFVFETHAKTRHAAQA
ncbi:dihydrofolate reductase [Moraxella nasibovis]|uniref:dihydrofolate reductase n=1 Tax=Moraxella nasibovis TaxID=2904120 RepID=UPI00240EE908|nr:dihydrofolate reductase [Moraxella nasibovis]WFF38186.1 dihydrofolate reductase [Moraxella nasibovis]